MMTTKKSQTKPSLWPPDVYSPEWWHLQGLWGKLQAQAGTRLTGDSEGGSENVALHPGCVW